MSTDGLLSHSFANVKSEAQERWVLTLSFQFSPGNTATIFIGISAFCQNLNNNNSLGGG